MYCETVNDERISLWTELGSCAELDRYQPRGDDALDLLYPIPNLSDPVFWFARLKAKVEGQGEGTLLMRRLVEILDERGVTVVNALHPYGSMDMQTLTEFYKKYGFFEVEKGLMVRRPQEAAPL